MKPQRYRALVITAIIGVIFIILVGLAIIFLAGDGDDPALDQDVQEVGLAGRGIQGPAPAPALVAVAKPAEAPRWVYPPGGGRAV